ncbi:MAG TPA: hypothetical protein VH518_12220 [Tepidisphaeraceae bacterium]|jgi:hypothetical protein
MSELNFERAIPLPYASAEEWISWSVVVRAVVSLVTVYSAMRFMASAASVAVNFAVQGGLPAGSLVYTLIDPITTGLFLLAISIAGINYWLSGQGRNALVWAIVAYVVVHSGIVLLTLVAAMLTLPSVSVTKTLMIGNVVSRLLFTAADCLLYGSAAWFLTRRPMHGAA